MNREQVAFTVTSIRETSGSIIITTENGPSFCQMTPEGLRIKQQPIKIPKSKLLADTNLEAKFIVIPKWLATQKCIWNRNPTELGETHVKPTGTEESSQSSQTETEGREKEVAFSSTASK